jgi:hypothetical protein
MNVIICKHKSWDKKVKKENKKHRVIYEHIEHRSGSGEHDSRPKRERTREKQEKSWKKDFGIDS